MKTKNESRFFLWCIGICLLIHFIFHFIKQSPERVETWYAQAFYPMFSYLPKILFDWIPFSVGDLFYTSVFLYTLWLFFELLKASVKRYWKDVQAVAIKLAAIFLMLYTFFYLSWGLQYYRQPLDQHMQLDLTAISQVDYYNVLEEYIQKANSLRVALDKTTLTREGVRSDIERIMKNDITFGNKLSKTQVNGKYPLSSTLVSYFGVTGYFNPFTHEVQVNKNAPILSYPFTTAHELAHQMGIGFEDECNFIAFVKLTEHPCLWYQYCAYYEAIQSLLRPIRFWDKDRFDQYYDQLDDRIREDFDEERIFWKQYSGWIDQLTGAIYDNYLQHNNQPEGRDRYSMMNRFVIAWEKKKQSSE